MTYGNGTTVAYTYDTLDRVSQICYTSGNGTQSGTVTYRYDNNGRQLRAGDRLQMLNGEYVIIEQVQHEILESSIGTYNFEVEGFHTYHVGNLEVLVHNRCNSVNQMNHEIETGKAPKGIERIHSPNSSVPNSQIHAHFTDGTALNIDGSIHDSGVPHLTNSIRKWLIRNGWKI